MRVALLVLLIACSKPAPIVPTTPPVGHDPDPGTEVPAKSDDKLVVDQLDPAIGDPDGGTYVRVTGTSFLHDAKGDAAPANVKVYFGSRQGELVRFVSDTELIVQAPGGKPGEEVDVLLIFDGRGEQKIATKFHYRDQ